MHSPIPALRAAAIRRLSNLALLTIADKPRLPEAAETLVKAVPLVKTYDFQMFVDITGSLFSIFPALKQAIAAKLDNQGINVRAATIRALTPLLGEHADLRQAVAAKLDDQDFNVRAATIEALTALLGEHANLRQAVAAKLDDPNDEYGQVRAAAVRALTPLLGERTDVRQAIAAKLDDPNDKNKQVRTAAIEALTPLLGERLDLRQAIAAKLDDQDSVMRAAAIEALTALLSEHADLRQAVAAKMDDQDSAVRAATIRALTALLGEHVDIRHTVAAKLDDQDSDVRAAAIRALTALPEKLYKVYQTSIVNGLNELKCLEANQSRAAAISALTALLGEHVDLRLTVAAGMDDQDSEVRAAAIKALTPLLGERLDLRQAVVSKLDDQDSEVRAAAIRALTPLLIEHADLRQAVASKLNDRLSEVRAVAIRALASLIPSQVEIRLLLKPALAGVKTNYYNSSDQEVFSDHEALVNGFGKWIEQDLNGRTEVITMLQSEDSRLRQTAAEILAQAGKDALMEGKPQLLQALDDYRGYDSWPTRITTAELLLNHINYSQEAINTLLPALEYCTHPLVNVRNAAEIRKQAALALGKLKAEFRRPEVAEKIKDLLTKEKDPQVLDSLFSALQSLAAAPE